MKITIAKSDFKKEPELTKKTLKNNQKTHEKNASSQAKNFIRRNNTYKLEEKPAPKSRPSNLTYLFYFLFIVGFAVLMASIWRLFITYNEKSFNTKAYSVLVVNDKGTFVVALNSENRSMTTLSLQVLKHENKLKTELANGIPIDAIIETKKEVEELFTYPNYLSFLSRFSKTKLQDMNGFDYFRMITSVTGINNKDKRSEALRISDGEFSLSQEELFDIFKDSDVIHEGLGIEIINATDLNGLAGGVANILKPLGVNIVSLSSEDVVQGSVVKARKKSMTSSKIAHLLKIPVVVEEPSSIADITIILGQDFKRKIK